MVKSEEIKRFEDALNADEELCARYAEAVKRIAEAGEATCDGEVLVKAAAELGYDISLAELERSYAESQDLSDEELETVAGGRSQVCLFDYYCYTAIWHDEHDPWGRKEQLACWSDWKCVFFNH